MRAEPGALAEIEMGDSEVRAAQAAARGDRYSPAARHVGARRGGPAHPRPAEPVFGEGPGPIPRDRTRTPVPVRAQLSFSGSSGTAPGAKCSRRPGLCTLRRRCSRTTTASATTVREDLVDRAESRPAGGARPPRSPGPRLQRLESRFRAPRGRPAIARLWVGRARVPDRLDAAGLRACCRDLLCRATGVRHLRAVIRACRGFAVWSSTRPAVYAVFAVSLPVVFPRVLGRAGTGSRGR